ncbi:MAG TPA: hypothetical protein PKG60_14700 [Spirochaetota bacterium]|jgi:hypothetical protein|nr:hypothetical protein [Spirochaetota bacterium]HPS88184.1 hypothetical protein [Spirochaetota bacterium]
MWPIAKKYETKCFIKDTDSMISEHMFEAINKDEAEARAYLNCVKENKNKRNVYVRVKKVLFVN